MKNMIAVIDYAKKKHSLDFHLASTKQKQNPLQVMVDKKVCDDILKFAGLKTLKEFVIALAEYFGRCNCGDYINQFLCTNKLSPQPQKAPADDKKQSVKPDGK